VARESFTGAIVGQETDLWLPASMQGVLAPNQVMLEDQTAY
jgi:hypothetical protein